MARSQKVVLKIGHVDILLPDDTGVALLKAPMLELMEGRADR